MNITLLIFYVTGASVLHAIIQSIRFVEKHLVPTRYAYHIKLWTQKRPDPISWMRQETPIWSLMRQTCEYFAKTDSFKVWFVVPKKAHKQVWTRPIGLRI